MIKIGRYTAALSLTALGILLLLDHAGFLDVFAVLGAWWPAALVALGIELIVVQSIHRQEGKRVRISFGILFGAFILGGFVLAAARGSNYHFSSVQEWTRGITWGLYDSDRAKHSFDKGVTSVPLPAPGTKVTVSDVNGNVTLTEGPVSEIEVKAVVYVDVSDMDRARELADRSSVRITDDDGLQIAAYVEPYGVGNLRKPRMDITVTLPQGRVPVSMEVNVGSGSVRLDQLTESSELALDVKNGGITGNNVGGGLHAKLLNGDIELTGLMGDADLEIVNGDLKVRDPKAAISAQTVTGDVSVRGSAVRGDWKASSKIGDIDLAWPEGTGVTVSARTTMGDVNDSWSLDRDGNEVSGTIGDGTRKITAETHGGDISLEKLEP